MKKGSIWKKIILSVVILIIVFAVYMFFGFQNMKKEFQKTKINAVDLQKIKDGEYTGSYKNFLVQVDLKVTVKNKKITDIRVISQDCGPGYEAAGLIPKIMKAQSLKVDAVTGATGSSIAILKAVERALTSEKK